MYYIVFDLEFNQDFSSSSLPEKAQCPFEIIQIGAVKLDLNFNTVEKFNRFVKPVIYPQMNPLITELTGITAEQLLFKKTFSQVFHDFVSFIAEKDSVFCVWGTSDMKELFRNTKYFKLNEKLLPERFINLQPYVTSDFKLPKSKPLKLQTAIELLKIPMPHPFHNALNDAYYTAEIMKKMSISEIQPQRYDPNYVKVRPRQPKKSLDVEKLLQQFEKMFIRELSEEEKDMIVLAYKMGRTHQFLK